MTHKSTNQNMLRIIFSFKKNNIKSNSRLTIGIRVLGTSASTNQTKQKKFHVYT